MARLLGEFVVGSRNFPDWIKDEMKRGRARVVNDTDGEFRHVTIHTPSGTKTAKKGDKIFLTNSGMTVMPADKVEKYMGGR